MSAERSNLLAALQRTQTDRMSASKLKPQRKQRHDAAIRDITSGNDETVHNDLTIGEMNSFSLRTNRATSSESTKSVRQQHFLPGKLYPLLPGRLSFTAHESDEHTVQEIQSNPTLFFFSTDLQERYLPFCSDFGPVNLGTLVQFCDYVRDKEDDKRLRNRHLVYYCTNDVESVSNTAFLIAAYLMLEHAYSPEEAVEPFRNLVGIPVVPFRDPTYVKSTFPLTVKDCLTGIKKAVEMGWFDLNDFDLERYEDMDHPDNGDMHQICPKFIAFRGPEQRQSEAAESGASRPEDVARTLKKLKVGKVVRLNEPDTYNRKVFERAGILHADLFFDDCTTPSDELVVRFLEECEGEEVVGVHCLAGLGRTGTMIGVWMMSKHGFTAREAIAWMRIVRPGCVIGPQQHFLEWMEARIRDGNFPPSSDPASSSKRSSSSSSAADLIASRSSSSLSEQLADQVRKAISSRRAAS